MWTETKNELRRFAESTTIKNVGRIVKAKRTAIRVFWLLAFLTGLGLLIFQATTVIVNYNKHTVIKNSGVVQRRPIFPDVTVCSQFPLSNVSFLQFYPKYLNVLKFIDNLVPTLAFFKSGYGSLSNNAASAVLGNLNQYALNSFDFSAPADNIVFDGPIFASSIGDLFLQRGLVNCSSKPRLMISIPTGLMPPNPQWCNTFSCSDSNNFMAKAIFTNNYFQIDLDVLSPIDLFNLGFGFNVMIHPRGTLPNPYQAIYVPRGTVFTIRLKQKNVTRLQAPWGNCTTQTVLEPGVEGSATYDANTCVDTCIQNQFIDQCGCLAQVLMFTEDQLFRSNFTFCTSLSNLFTIKDFETESLDTFLSMQCESLLSGSLRSVLKETETRVDCWTGKSYFVDQCDCPDPCSEIRYDTTVSTVAMDPFYQYNFITNPPAYDNIYDKIFNIYTNILDKDLNQSFTDTLNQLKNISTITDNFVDLTVTFVNENTYLETDIKGMTWDVLASNIGSSLNLWLAISVPTAAELLEMMYTLLVIWCGKKQKEKIETLHIEGGEEVSNSTCEINSVVSLEIEEEEDNQVQNNTQGPVDIAACLEVKTNNIVPNCNYGEAGCATEVDLEMVVYEQRLKMAQMKELRLEIAKIKELLKNECIHVND